MSIYTGTKPKVKRTLFQSESDLIESAPLIDNVKTGDAIEFPLLNNPVSDTPSRKQTPIVPPPPTTVRPRPTRSNRDYKVIPSVDNPEVILRKKKPSTKSKSSDSINFQPTPSTIFDNLKSLFSSPKTELKFENSHSLSFSEKPTGFSTPSKHFVENQKTVLHNTPVKSIDLSNGNFINKSNQITPNESIKVDPYIFDQSEHRAAINRNSEAINRSSSTHHVSESALPVRDLRNYFQGESNPFVLKSKQDCTQQTNTLYRQHNKPVDFPTFT